MSHPEIPTLSSVRREFSARLHPTLSERLLPSQDKIENLYYYSAHSWAFNPETAGDFPPDTRIYRILLKSGDLSIVILHSENRPTLELEVYPDIAICIPKRDRSLIIVSPKTGAVIEAMELAIEGPGGRKYMSRFLNIDSRISLSDLIIRNQVQEPRYDQVDLDLTPVA